MKSSAVQRVAFLLRLKPGKIQEYEEAHRNVWPELLEEMTAYGITDYSIFRRGQQLFLYMKVPDFDTAMRRLAASEVNRRWQAKMTSLFEPADYLEEGEPFAMMQEVFFMPGHTRHTDEAANKV